MNFFKIINNVTFYRSNRLYYCKRNVYNVAKVNNGTKSLYSFGCNKDGKLCNDNELVDCESYPFKIEKFKNENNEIINYNQLGGIRDITCGHYHTMIINSTGKLYTSGWTSFTGNSSGVTNLKSTLPTLIQPLKNENIIQVSGGRRHILALSNDGKVFSFGVNSEYQLGIGNNLNQSNPIQVEFEKQNINIIKLVSGWGHSLALCDNGDIYSWGWSADSQTGHGFNDPIKKPTLLKTSHKFKNVFSGSDYITAITDNGEIVTFGSNEFGQLGNGNQINQPKPTLINSEPLRVKLIMNDINSKRISCGFSHTLLIDDNGELFTCGWNGNGQLGIMNENVKFQNTFKKVNSIQFGGEKLSMVSAGRNHSIVLTESGRIYLFGNGNHGKLGNGRTSGNQHTPTELFDFDEHIQQSFPLEFHKVINISTGFDHTLIELEDLINK